jgi:epoxyqueuosine reductase QueG
MLPSQLTSELKAEAERLGFGLAAACPAVSPVGATRLGEWLHLGYGGEMDYIGLPQQGSNFFLAALLTDQELVYDEPQDASFGRTGSPL